MPAATRTQCLIAAGQNSLVMTARLGHASIVETMDIYGHLFELGHAETTAVLDTHSIRPDDCARCNQVCSSGALRACRSLGVDVVQVLT